MALIDLQTALQNVDSKILDLTTNMKPSYSINGQNIQWGEFYDQLMKMRQSLLNQIVIAEGPGEYVNEGTT